MQIDVDDEQAQIDSMVPVPGDELPVRACVSIWVDAHDNRAPIEAILDEVGVRRAGYLVTESLYREYGGNEHSPPHDWPDGTRSPGIITLTVFDKPVGVDDETFYGHWYGHQSPMSEWMQPRARYVRNAVVRALTPGAPRFRAIVEEAWPTVEHLTNLQTFFGADRTTISANASASCSTAPSCCTTRHDAQLHVERVHPQVVTTGNQRARTSVRARTDTPVA